MRELFIREPANRFVRVCNAATLVIALLFLLVFAGCAPARSVQVDKTKPWAEFKLSIDKSSTYPPTFSVYVQDDTTGEISTLYVTGKMGRNELSNRPGALPVWSAMRGKSGNQALDAVTQATPSGADASLTVQIPDKYKGKALTFFVEANVSYDYNDYFKKGLKIGDAGYNDVNGQPSIIWKASVDTAASPSGTLTPTLAGHGDVLGANGNLDSDMANITTAAAILKDIQITYNMVGK